MLKFKQLPGETSLSPSTIKRLIESGDFPPPVQLSPGRVGWPDEEVKAWKERRPRSPRARPSEHAA